MQALRVEAEGLTTSFRYSHFLVGRQPTYRMPPPATIYGHVCSAVGEYVDHTAVRFAYVFTYEGIGDDLELLHVAAVKNGRWPGAGNHPMNLEVTTNPSPREILLLPHLTLYLASEDSGLVTRLEDSLIEPRYAVTLGRSQDLLAYEPVRRVELVEAEATYFEGTLLPWSYRARSRDGIGVTMPRFIDPLDRRRVVWSPFLMVQDRLIAGDEANRAQRSRVSIVRRSGERWWTDPETPSYHGLSRGVMWHAFVPDDDALAFIGTPQAPLG